VNEKDILHYLQFFKLQTMSQINKFKISSVPAGPICIFIGTENVKTKIHSSYVKKCLQKKKVIKTLLNGMHY
jgi:hypothetical protein